MPVLADGDRIRQALANYLTNAVKYSPPDQPIAVLVRRSGGGEARRGVGSQGEPIVCVEARDMGLGLSEEQQRHVFERFHRAPGIEALNGSGIGLGLGLYISKTNIERHGGSVGVDSAPGQGSTFWFALPLTLEMNERR